MKVIYPDNIANVVSDKADTAYPVTNLQNNYVKKVWKSSDHEGVITAAVSSGSAVALFGSNATAATVKLRTGSLGGAWNDASATGVAAQWNDAAATGLEGAWKAESLATQTVTFDTLVDNQASFWCDFTDPGVAFGLEITLSCASGTILQAGVLRCGTVNDFVDPKYGIQEGLHDYSVQRELNNGAWYYLKRDIVRTFSFSLLEDRASDFYTFMHTVALAYGQRPLAWRISETVTDWQWIVFAVLEGLPTGSHAHKDHSLINVKLKEVV